MRENAKACQRREIERLSTEKLDEILQQELRKDMPDEDVVMPILEILAEREADQPVEISEEAADAWERYQKRISSGKNAHKKMSWIGKIAAIAAVVAVLIIAVPMSVDADGTLDVLYRLTESVIEFFSPGGRKPDPDGKYVFETDNPGLQQVYDKVVELGVTEPVVPMWLPDGYVLQELEESLIPGGTKVYAKFALGNDVIVMQIKVSDNITSTQYEQEDGFELYEIDRIKHFILTNEDYLSAMWVCKKAECLINSQIDRQQMIRILCSIYRRE